MTFYLRHALVLAICISLGACAFKKDDAENKQRQDLADDVAKKMQDDQKNAGVDLKESNVSVDFEDSDPGYYTLVVKWPETIGTMEVYINDVLKKSVEGTNTYKSTIGQGETFTLKLRAYASAANGARYLSGYQNTFTAKKDMLVYSDVNLSENLDMHVHRVYFKNDAQIVTNGYDVRIDTDYLYVEAKTGNQLGAPAQYSNVVTFKDSEAPLSANTRASNIDITAKKAIGKLYFAMIGRNGIDGKDGLPLSAPQATSGSNGTNGAVKFRPPHPCTHRNMDIPCEEPAPMCSITPGNGGNGSDGINGNDGQDGTPGSDTGNLSIHVNDDTNFSIEVYQHPGKGGRGGKGSPGQLGGAGGAPGNRPSDACAAASAGKPGKNGADGLNGKDGSDGKLGTVSPDVKSQRIITDAN